MDNKQPFEIEVFYNELGEIVRISKISSREDDDFTFRVIYIKEWDCYIMHATQFYDQAEEWEDVSGFFLLRSGKCIFISNSDYPFSIMDLDSNLKPSRTLRFELDTLKHKTVINYVNGNHLCSETFYKRIDPFKLEERSLWDDVLKQFDHGQYEFDKEWKIGWVRETDYLPIWVFAGGHEFDHSDSKPFDCTQ